MNELISSIDSFVDIVNQMQIENEASRREYTKIINTISEIRDRNKENAEALDIATHAIEIIRSVSDEAVKKAYDFIEEALNKALERMFRSSERKVEIVEYTRNNQYPQLELRLHTDGGKVRSLKSDSGHGIAQIVSLLSILALIVITGERRILVLDEALSGVSVNNRRIINDILWNFTDIGFQFIINEHGFVPEGAHVYHLENKNGTGYIKKEYIASSGVYLQGTGKNTYDYEENTSQDNDTEQSNSDEQDIKDNNSSAEDDNTVVAL